MNTPRLIRISTVVLAIAAAPIHAQQRPSLPSAAIAGGVSVTGTVTDPAGRPVMGALVSLLSERTYLEPELRDARHQPRFGPVDMRFGVRTDKAGRYSLPAIAPGQYLVVAIGLSQPLLANKQPSTVGFGTTYFPSARTPDSAKPVSVSKGGAATADIRMLAAPLASVSGTVVTAAGKLAKGGTLHMARGDGLFGLGSGNTAVRPDGTFTIRVLPPGTYFLRYNEDDIVEIPDSGPRAMPRVSGATVVMTGADIPSVRLAPLTPATVKGRVVVKSNSGPNAVDISTLRVSGFPFVLDGNPGPQLSGLVAKNLTFEFQTWPSLGYIRVFSGVRQVVPSAVRVKGIDVTKTGIDFQPGTTIYNVEVELTIR